MCYDVESQTKAALKKAQMRGGSLEEIEALKMKLEQFKAETPYYHVSGFAHPKLLAFTDKDPLEPQFFKWGLIPAWVKDKISAGQLSNQTLNARGETIFEKPSFQSSAKTKRCLIYLDAFYEHHHFKGKTYPFRISFKDDSPLPVAGLWSEWIDKETGEIIPTLSIVTTEANTLMQKIHNNPKAEGPRMPVIFTKETQNEWLIPCTNEDDKKHIQSLIKPCDENLLNAYTVGRLKGKEAVGNIPEIENEIKYPELTF